MTHTAFAYEQPIRPNPFAQLIEDTRQRTAYYLVSTVELDTIYADPNLSWAQRGILTDIIRRCYRNPNQSVRIHVKDMADEANCAADTLYKNLRHLEQLGYITRGTRRKDNATEVHYCVPSLLEQKMLNAPARTGREDYVSAVPVVVSKKTKKETKATPVTSSSPMPVSITPAKTAYNHPYALTEAEHAYTSLPGVDISHWPLAADLPIPEVLGPFLDLSSDPLTLPKLFFNPPIPNYLPQTLDTLVHVTEYDYTNPTLLLREVTLPLATILGRVYAFLYRTAALSCYMDDHKVMASSVNLLGDYTAEELAEFELSSLWYWTQVDAAAFAPAPAPSPSAEASASAEGIGAHVPEPNEDESDGPNTSTAPQRFSRNYVRPLPAGSLPTSDALNTFVRTSLSDMLEEGLIHANCRQKHFSTLVDEVLYYLNQPYTADRSGKLKPDAREARWASVQRLLRDGQWCEPKGLAKQKKAREDWHTSSRA
ncbi:MAG: hypothetical protein V4490_02950 [Pseudomonadota bacterium]